MTTPKFLTHAEAVKAHWFSRRHETSEPNRLARLNYQHTRGKQARQARATEREEHK